MPWQALLAAQAMPEYVAALAMILLAAWLLRLQLRDPANVAFAAFLVLRALTMFASTFLRLTAEPDLARVWDHARAVTVIATTFALLYFVLVYPHPRILRARPWRLGLLLLGAALAVEAIFFFQSDLWATYRVDAAGALQFERLGPLYGFQFLRDTAIGVAALVFALDHVRTRSEEARSLFVVSLAFGLHAAYDGSNALLLLFSVPYGSIPGAQYALLVVNALILLPLTATVLLLRRPGPGHPDAAGPRDARRYAIALLLPILSNLLVFGLVQAGLEPPNGPVRLFFLGVWRLSLPLLVTYALLRHRLFRIDITVRKTVKRSALAIVFILVFSLVTESAESLLTGGAAPYVAILAATLLALLLDPLQKLAERLAAAAVPATGAHRELTREEAAAVYAEQARVAWADGSLSPKERRMLDLIRERLGLEAEEAARLEETVLPGESGDVPKQSNMETGSPEE